MNLIHVLVACGLAALLAACGGEARSDAEAQTYTVRGEFVGTQYEGQAAIIRHEPIPGFMDAMQMTLRLDDPAEAERLEPGAKIRFDYVVSETSGYIENLERLPDTTRLDLSGLHPPGEAHQDTTDHNAHQEP